MTLRFLLALFLSLAALAPRAQAHEIRPAYLQIDEQTPHHYKLLWKVPTRDGMVQDIRPAFEPGFTLTPLPGESVVNGFVLFRYTLTGERALPGTVVKIDNLERTAIDALVEIRLLDGTRHSFLLKPRDSARLVPKAPSAWEVVTTYTRLGVEHILAGVDHLAFVAALILVVRGWPMLLKTVTAFTVAHSITLALATFGYVSLPSPPVEALIALSIVLIAVEAVHLRRGRESLATRWPWIVAFAFGLLHGLGFAGALREIGLPQGDIPLALLFFNIGVELGQLCFIALLSGLVALARRLVSLPRIAPVAAAYAIGAVAMFWVIQRLDGMFL
ncbi:HupE/UreJ family protein [Paracoccus sp. MBLB3053]|uniref:HupE/UreJ family protein n=1 Tax=Paracoccus aurantius TaxID=3073814 RepID=A0ABU2HSA7_9RHOB|nr:HupE/UreJ family protein [Paracoccus sp. MBLB3053]MDS9467911.1 HupE/UreJ family protein [Paracoccus sp. MBLB3053]